MNKQKMSKAILFILLIISHFEVPDITELLWPKKLISYFKEAINRIKTFYFTINLA